MKITYEENKGDWNGMLKKIKLRSFDVHLEFAFQNRFSFHKINQLNPLASYYVHVSIATHLTADHDARPKTGGVRFVAHGAVTDLVFHSP